MGRPNCWKAGQRATIIIPAARLSLPACQCLEQDHGAAATGLATGKPQCQGLGRSYLARGHIVGVELAAGQPSVKQAGPHLPQAGAPQDHDAVEALSHRGPGLDIEPQGEGTVELAY